MTNSHTVTLLVRESCGSCHRVHRQIAPVVAAAGAPLAVIDVDDRDGGAAVADLAREFGDRLPVVLVDGDEFACWEVDDAELAAALR